MTNDKFQEKLVEKKIDSYNSNVDINFKVEEEILVTITLKEYRDLIKTSAYYATNNEEYRKKFYKLYDEKEALEKQIKDLENKILNSFKTTTEDDAEDEGDEEI